MRARTPLPPDIRKSSGRPNRPKTVRPAAIVLPSGCSERLSAAAARSLTSASLISSPPRTALILGRPSVRVPVLSKAIRSASARRSKASPSRTSAPSEAARPMAAITAVGVARTSAHGQKTTRIVTARISSPVTSHTAAAAVSAAKTI